MKNLDALDGLGRILVMIVQSAYINLLWILFTLFGLVFLGFAPSSLAMFTITREWINGNSDIPIFGTFWDAYKSNFFKANLIFYIIVFFGSFLYLYWILIQPLNGVTYYLILSLFLSGLAPYVVILLYIFPTMANYDIKTMTYFKYALFIGISSPMHTLFMAVFVGLIVLALFIMPIFTPLFSGIIISLIMMWIAMRAFHKKEALE